MTKKLSEEEKEERRLARQRNSASRQCSANPDDHERRYQPILYAGQGRDLAMTPQFAGSRGSHARAHIEPEQGDDIDETDLTGLTIIYT